MEFQKSSSATELELRGITQGRRVLIIITQASQDAVLEFKHAGDTWRPDPRFIGTHTEGVIMEELLAPSTKLRLRFLSEPTRPYFVSVAHEFTPGS